jgi:methylated-DNA-protein-cysteine methyltransferase related protein
MDFAERVYRVVQMIPEGCVTNYGSISRALGAPRGARLVGWALRHSPDAMKLPAHRVVNRNGVLTGAAYFGPPDVMRHLLEDEGVTFLDEITVDLKRHYWDPAEDPRVDELYQFREG